MCSSDLPGNVASDGTGANGLYTEHLLREIRIPDTRVEDVFKRVRLGVRLKSRGAQIPWESTSLEDDFWFLPPRELKKLSEQEKDRLFKEEEAAWGKARATGTVAAVERGAGHRCSVWRGSGTHLSAGRQDDGVPWSRLLLESSQIVMKFD